MPRKTQTDQKRRLLTLLDALPVEGRHGIGPGELAQRMASSFGVEDYLDPPDCAPGTGEKRLQRDLRSLEDLFGSTFIIKDGSYRNRPLYWKSAAAKLPGVDAHTALALKVAGSVLRPILPPATFAKLEEHFSAGEQVLRHLTRTADWHHKVQILQRGQPLLPPEVDAGIQQVVQQSLFEGRQITLRYRKKWNQRVQSYEGLHPAGLIMRGPLIYLVAFKSGEMPARHFALHRIVEAEKLANAASIPDDFSLEGFVADGEPSIRIREEPIQIGLLMDAAAAEHLRETALSKDQTLSIVQSDGRIHVTATVPWTQELEWWILGFGNRAEVVAPAELRERIAEEVIAAAAAYT